jgi:hypothetical protein
VFIYAGKSFTATQTGSRTVPVHCEKCQTEFFYDLVRQGTGQASAPYYIGQRGAQRRAEKAAAKALAKKLARDSELVPCPACHWINESLAISFRKMRLRWIVTSAVVLSFVIFLITFIVCAAQPRREFSETWYLDLLYSALAILPIVGLAAVTGRILAGRINPNRNFPHPPRLLPGTPRGWTTAELSQPRPDDQGRYVPPAEADEIYPGWALFRAGRMQLAPVCCECLAPATAVYKPWFTLNKRPSLSPPLCRDCRSRLRQGWFLAALGTVLASFAGAFILAFSLVNHTADQLPLAIVFGVILAVVSLAIVPNYFTKPFSLRVVDKDRAIYRIWFRNEQYTELVRASARKLEEQLIRQPFAVVAAVQPSVYKIDLAPPAS